MNRHERRKMKRESSQFWSEAAYVAPNGGWEECPEDGRTILLAVFRGFMNHEADGSYKPVDDGMSDREVFESFCELIEHDLLAVRIFWADAHLDAALEFLDGSGRMMGRSGVMRIPFPETVH